MTARVQSSIRRTLSITGRLSRVTSPDTRESVAGAKSHYMVISKAATNSPNVLARTIIDKIHAIQEAIPGHTPATPTEGRALIPAATLPSPFIEAACSAIESSDSLRIAMKMEPDAARDAVAFAIAFESVADELDATARVLRHTINVIRAKAGDDALHS